MAELPAAGSTFAGKYVIERELGRGAAGVVLAAMHTGLKQRVAIKVLREAGGVAVERMTREARAALSLHSEHVVRVMDVGTDDDRVYLVMELLEGVDLGSLLKQRGPLPIAEAVDCVLQVCAGVAEAHAAGVVHRDLKPGNLFLTTRSDGGPLVKVLDFGISKVDLAGGVEASLTGPAEVLGSPMYMAPEQVRGARHVDVRADVWSLGVVLFRLVTGKGPFGSPASVSAALASVVADEPTRLRELLPEAPRELEQVVLGCMAKDPAARIASMGELATRLAPFGTGDGRAAVARLLRARGPGAAARPRRARWPLVLAGIATLAAVPVAALALRSRAPADTAVTAAEPIPSSAPPVATSAIPAATSTLPPASAPTASPAPPAAARPPIARPAARPRSPPNAAMVRSAATDDRY